MARHHFSVHRLSEQDIGRLIRLSKSVGWDYDAPEIKTILSSGSVYGHKTSAGEVVSCAAIIPYGKAFASLGMVIVDPNCRRLGLGKEAVTNCIQSVPGSMPVTLISTPEGKPMYEHLGFKSMDSVQKLLCDSYHPLEQGDVGDHALVPFQPRHLPEIVKLDESAYGAKREKFLTVRLKQAKRVLTVKNSSGNLVGYGASIQGPERLLLGPIVAPNDRIAVYLLDGLARETEGRLRMDVPGQHGKFASQLIPRGFEVVSSPPVMLFNGERLPPRNGTLFGISAQIFG